MTHPDGPGLNPLAIARFFGAPRGFYEPYFAEYGELFYSYLPGLGPAVFTSSPEHHKALYLKDRSHCEAGDDGMLEPILGPSSLLVSEGEHHKRHRQLLSPPFHGERMRAYGELMRRIANERIDGWEDGQTITLQEEMSSLTLDLIIRAIFGLDHDEEKRKDAHARLTHLLDSVGPFTLFVKAMRIDLGKLSPWGRVKAALAQADELLYAEIAARREADLSEQEDILSLMLQVKDEEGEGLSDQEIRDELLTLLVAGHETTATSLTWAAYWLDRQGDARARLEAEIEQAGVDAEPEAIAQLEWLGAVANEVLRLEPTIPETARRLTQPLELGGYTIDAGTYVLPSIWGTHHRADIYDDPDAFKPERFLQKSYSPFEFLPFGGGVRKCIGYAFALYEMKMVLFDMVRRTRLRVVDEEVSSVRRNFSVGPSGGLPVRVERRGG